MRLNFTPLEERVVLDAAAAHDLVSLEDLIEEQNYEAMLQELAHQESQEEEAFSSQLIVLSSEVPNPESFIQSLQSSVKVVYLDDHIENLDQIYEEINETLAGSPVHSIAFASHGSQAQFQLHQDISVEKNSLKDPQMQAFWQKLSSHIVEEGRIDLLACDLASHNDGLELMEEIEKLSQREVAASDDITGNYGQESNWILEVGQIDLQAQYFESGLISSWQGSFTQTQAFSFEADGALSFDGIDDHILVAPHSSLDFSSSMTVEMWIFIEEGSTEPQVLVDKGDSGNHAYEILFSPQGNGKVSLSDGSSLFTSIQSLEENRWTHIAIAAGPSETKIYLNGQLDSQHAAFSFPQYTSAPLYIAKAHDTNSSAFHGKMDEIRLWNSMRSELEIQENYEKLIHSPNADLSLYYRLDSSHGDISYDFSSHGNHGSLEGSIGHAQRHSHDFTQDSEDWKTLQGERALTPLHFSQGGPWDENPLSRSSYLWDGSSSYIDAGSSLDLRQQDFTLSAWAQRDSLHTAAPIFSQGTDPDHALQLGYDEQGLVFSFEEQEIHYALQDSLWHHIVASYEESTGNMVLYVDGQEVRQGSDTSFLGVQVQDSFIIGRSPDSSHHFHGGLSDLRVYKDKLSSLQVQELYEGNLSSLEPALHVDMQSAIEDRSIQAHPVQVSADLTSFSPPPRSDGYISLYSSSPQDSFFINEESLTQALKSSYGASLHFDLRQLDSSQDATSQEDLLLVSQSLSLYYDLQSPENQWTHYEVDLVEGQWRVQGSGELASQETLLDVLDNLESVQVRAAFQESGNNLTDLDGIFIEKDMEVTATWIASSSPILQGVRGQENQDLLIHLSGINSAHSTASDLSPIISSLPSQGQVFQYDGTLIDSENTAVTDPQGRIIFRPESNQTSIDPQTAYSSFDFHVASMGSESSEKTVLIYLDLVNDLPYMVEKNSPTVLEGQSIVIDAFALHYEDESHPSQITYTLESLPSHGVLVLNGQALAVGDQFTQHEINRIRLRYEHQNLDSSSQDSFTFSVQDEQGLTLPVDSFHIHIQASNDHDPHPGGDLEATILSSTQLQEDARYELIEISGIQLQDADASTPQSIRIASVQGGQVFLSDLSTITLGEQGSLLTLESDGSLQLAVSPNPQRDEDLILEYFVVDSQDSQVQSTSSFITVPLQSSQDAPVLIEPHEKALYLEGVNDYLELPSWDYTGNLTLSTWIHAQNLEQNTALIDLGTSQEKEENIQLSLDEQGILSLTVYKNGMQESVQSTQAISLEEWTHLSLSMEDLGNGNSSVKIYENGSLIFSSQIQTPSQVTRTENFFGAFKDSPYTFFQGQVDELYMFHSSLTEQDLASMAIGELDLSQNTLLHSLDFAYDFQSIHEDMLLDLSNQERHAQMHGGYLMESEKHSLLPSLNQALALDGVDGAVILNDLNFQGEMTLSSWVYLEKHASEMYLFEWAQGQEEDNIAAYVDESGHLHIRIFEQGSWHELSTSSTLPMQEWTHLAISLENRGPQEALVKVYVNGNIHLYESTEYISLGMRGSSYLGKSLQDSYTPFEGKLDHLAIYSEALQQSEVKQIMHGLQLDLDTQVSLEFESSMTEEVFNLASSDRSLSSVLLEGGASLVNSSVEQIEASHFFVYLENSGFMQPFALTEIQDKDLGDSIHSLRISIAGDYDASQDFLSYEAVGNIQGSFHAPSGTLELHGEDSSANYTRVLRSIAFANLSENPSLGTRTISVEAFDGNEFSKALTKKISIERVEDPALAIASGPGTSLLFDGQDDFAQADALALENKSYTFSLWAKALDTDRMQTLIHLDNPAQSDPSLEDPLGSQSLSLFINAEGKLGTTLGSQTLLSNTSIQVGDWQLYTLSHDLDSQVRRLYVNGELVAEDTATGSLGDFSFQLASHAQSAGENFHGLMDELRIHSTALSESEIQEDMSRLLAGDEEDLLAYYRFDEGKGDRVQDLSSSENHLRLGSLSHSYQTLASSSFSPGSELKNSWTITGLAQREFLGQQEYEKGYDQGYLSSRFNDASWSYWKAPEEFLGDQNAAYGQSLHFALKNEGSGEMIFQNDVILKGVDFDLYYQFDKMPDLSQWSSIFLPLHEQASWIRSDTGEMASQEDLQAILGDLQDLLIRAEYFKHTEEMQLDSVAYLSSQKAHWLPSEAGISTVISVEEGQEESVQLGASDLEQNPLLAKIVNMSSLYQYNAGFSGAAITHLSPHVSDPLLRVMLQGQMPGQSSFTFQVSDDADPQSADYGNEAQVDIEIIPVNQEPSILLSTSTISIEEDSREKISSLLSNFSLDDPDISENIHGKMTLSLSIDKGLLFLNPRSSLQVLSGSLENSQAMEIRGSLQALQEAMQDLEYQSHMEHATLSIEVNDEGNTGLGGEKISQESLSIQVIQINNAPEIHASNTLLAIEDQVVSLPTISLSDADFLTQSQAVLEIDIQAQNGTLSFQGQPRTQSIHLEGTLEELETLLTQVDYLSLENAHGQDEITLLLNDQGSQTGQAALEARHSFFVDIQESNDAPSLSASSSISVQEEIPYTLDPILLSDFLDLESGEDAIFHVEIQAEHGSISLQGAQGLQFLLGAHRQNP